MSYEREVQKRLERCRKAKIAAIERDNRKPPEVIRYKGSLPQAIHEMQFPKDSRMTVFTPEAIYKDLEDLGLSYPYL